MKIDEPKFSNSEIDLDELDFSILSLLQKDGRMSLTDMAEHLGVSISTVRTRVSKLLDDKTIQIIGRVNTGRVGFQVYAQVLISVSASKLIGSVAEKLQELKEVSFLALTSGDFDLEMDVMCRDNDHLVYILNERISKIEGISRTKTNMFLKVLKLAQPDLSLVNFHKK